jgi:hypothetical protein
MTPFVLFWGAVMWLAELLETLAPVLAVGVGVASVIAAVLSAAVLVVAVRLLLPGERRWVRVLGQVVVAVEVVAVLAFLGVGAIAFVTASVVS